MMSSLWGSGTKNGPETSMDTAPQGTVADELCHGEAPMKTRRRDLTTVGKAPTQARPSRALAGTRSRGPCPWGRTMRQPLCQAAPWFLTRAHALSPQGATAMLPGIRPEEEKSHVTRNPVYRSFVCKP